MIYGIQLQYLNETALICAVECCNSDIVRLLVRYGETDISIRDILISKHSSNSLLNFFSLGQNIELFMEFIKKIYLSAYDIAMRNEDYDISYLLDEFAE